MKLTTKTRVLQNVNRNSACTSEDLVASDLRLPIGTVERCVKALMKLGFIERAPDGIALESSHEGRRFLRLGVNV